MNRSQVKDLLRAINYGWRVLATGFCFSLFGLGGLLLSLLCLILLPFCLLLNIPLDRLTQQLIRYSFRFFLETLRFLGVMDYRFEHAERFHEDQGCLVIANHPSLLDYVLLASRMPRCDCIVKAALMRNIFVRGVIKSAGYLANADSDRLLALCQQRLSAGNVMLIFPEGTRTTPGQVISLQRGAAQIALRSQCDIRIIHIHCTQNMLTKQGKWYNIPPKKPQFVIQVQNKINPQHFIQAQDISSALAARRLTGHLTYLLQNGYEEKN